MFVRGIKLNISLFLITQPYFSVSRNTIRGNTTKAPSMTSEDYSGLKIEDLMKKIGILDLYKLNIHHVINLMFTVKSKTIPTLF